jgi:hypothetical protein
MLFAYFGPETVLPATSALATAVGFTLMFGKQSVRLAGVLARRGLHAIRQRRHGASAIPAHHLSGPRSRPDRRAVDPRQVAAPWTPRIDP